MRAVAALSFIELVGWKARMVGETSSIMPTSLSSSVTCLSDSLNAAIGASVVLLCSSDTSSAVTFSAPESGLRRKRSLQSHSTLQTRDRCPLRKASGAA